MLRKIALQKYPLILLASTFLVTLTERVSIAFTITPPQPGATQFYRRESNYSLDSNRRGVTRVYSVEPLPSGGTLLASGTLKLWSVPSLGKWSFKKANKNLEGSFEIVTNQACGLNDGCGEASTGISPIIPTYRGVGSLFHVKYHPQGKDPRPGQGRLHWIQVVRANYGKIPGTPIDVISGIPFVDKNPGRSEPYYDYPGYRFAGEDFLMDQPYAGGRDNASRNTYFTAELYLVEETTTPGSGKRKVTIYNGIRWGWENKILSSGCPNQLNAVRLSLTDATDPSCPPQPPNPKPPDDHDCPPGTYYNAAAGQCYGGDP